MKNKPYMLSAKVIIRNEEGRCLLLRRSRESQNNAGKWEFPGGKLDPGETLDQALLREVREETGLAIALRGVVGVTETDLSDRKVIHVVFEAIAESSGVRLSSEHDDSCWVTLAELAERDLTPQFQEFAARYARGEARVGGGAQ